MVMRLLLLASISFFFYIVCEVECNATYEGNAVRVVCGESSDIQSITYYINRERNYTGLLSYYANLFLSVVKILFLLQSIVQSL